MTTIPEAFNQAIYYHRAGQLQYAEQLYRHILQADPRHADALHMMGVLAAQAGQADAAVHYYQQAVAVRPDLPAPHFDLAVTLRNLGRRDDAIASYRNLLRLQPDNADAHNNVANALRERGDLQEAIGHFQQALRLRPHFAAAWSNLANAFYDQKRLDEAIAHYRQAIRLQPDYPAAHNNLGVVLCDQGKLSEALACHREAVRLQPDYADAHNNLAHALTLSGQYGQAEAHAREALRLKPDHVGALNNLGNALKEQGKSEEALPCYRQAIQMVPEFSEAWNNLGAVLTDLGDANEGVVHIQRALQINPNYADGHSNLGATLADLGRLDEALVAYDHALRLEPGNANAHWNRSLTLLLRGDFEHGWPEYEYRLQRQEFTQRTLRKPRWDGSALDGKTILLFAEQGHGDTLQFVRYVPLVRQRGGKIIVECQPSLVQVLAGAQGIDQLLARGSPLPPFDVEAPLLSLPGIFHTGLTDIPATVPYLRADPALVDHWRKELLAAQPPGPPPFRIGIVWQGFHGLRGDRRRSIPLTEFAPLARLEGIELYSLQVGRGSEQVAALAGRFPLIDLGRRFDPASFADVAAVVMNMDVVITVDTAIAHLAGALGARVWVALPFIGEWRWLLNRDDSPWYPTMRLFRQHCPGDWREVFERLSATVQGAKLSQAAEDMQTMRQ